MVSVPKWGKGSLYNACSAHTVLDQYNQILAQDLPAYCGCPVADGSCAAMVICIDYEVLKVWDKFRDAWILPFPQVMAGRGGCPWSSMCWYPDDFSPHRLIRFQSQQCQSVFGLGAGEQTCLLGFAERLGSRRSLSTTKTEMNASRLPINMHPMQVGFSITRWWWVWVGIC